MKALLALLLTVSSLAAAPFSPWRLIGTNAVDFSLVYQSIQSPGQNAWANRYVPSGTVQSANPSLGTVTLVRSYTQYVYDPDAALRYGDSSDMLGALYATQRGPISLGHYMVLSPRLRMHYSRQQVEEKGLVVNYDGRPLKVGEVIQLAAWPLGNGQFDYGKSLTNLSGFVSVLLVTSNGVIAERWQTPSERRELRRNALEVQHRAATNGSGSAQYELGKHYFEQTNFVAAALWLRACKTNGYADAAQRLLDKIPVPEFMSSK